MKKRLAVSVMAVVLAALILLTGCRKPNPAQSNSPGGDSGTPAKPVNLRYAYISDEPVDAANVMKAVNEKLATDKVGVTLECVYIPDAEYVNKIAMLAAAKEDYDICWTMPVNIADMAAKGALAPLNKSLDAYGQNLKQAISAAQWKEVTFGGNIYGIPGLLAAASVDRTIQIRTDLMKKYGLDKIETVDDLEKYLLAYQKDHPEGKALYAFSGRELYREYGDIFEPIGKELKSPVCIELSDPTMTVKNYYKTDTFMKTVAKMRDWDGKGLYDPETPAKSLVPKLAQGLVGACWCVLNTHERIAGFKANATDPNAALGVVMLNPSAPKDLKVFAADNLSVFSMTKSVDASVKFISWLRGSQEAYDLMSYGVKGVNYNLDGESLNYDGIPAEKQYSPQNWMWSDIRYMRFDKALGPDYKSMEMNWDKGAKVYPFTGFTLDKAPILNEITQINALMDEYVPQLKDSKIDFQSTYDTFLAKLDQAGEQKVIDEVTKQIQAFIANSK